MKRFNLTNIKTGLYAALFAFVCLLSAPMYAADQSGMWHYTVRPGDNLISLGKRHLINPDDWKVVQSINHVKNPHRIPVGKVLYVPLDLVKQGPASAEVTFVSGQALMQVSATDYKPLKKGQKLGAGANIITKENTKIVIRFADGSTTELASNSQLRLDTMSLYSGGAMVDTRLRLQKGKLEMHANPKHKKGNAIRVITPSAIAAVRGTKFRVNADEKVMTQETLEGSVGLDASGQQVVVNQGFGSKAEQGRPPIPPVELLPAPNTSGLKKQHMMLPVAFEMPKMPGAAAWDGKIAQDAELNQLIAEAETQNDQLVFPAMPDGEYYLSIRAKDKNSIAGYDALHQFTLNAQPAQPKTVAPVINSTIRESQPSLKWLPVSNVRLYAVDIATDAAFKKIHESKRVQVAHYQLEKDLAPGLYFWRVSSIATNKNGEEDIGPATQVSQFTYKPNPPKPDISHLKVKIAKNRVMVHTVEPIAGHRYSAMLENDFNKQKNVWQGSDLGPQFDFLLKEYGKQTLYIKHVDSDGTAGPAAVYEFFAYPQ